MPMWLCTALNYFDLFDKNVLKVTVNNHVVGRFRTLDEAMEHDDA